MANIEQIFTYIKMANILGRKQNVFRIHFYTLNDDITRTKQKLIIDFYYKIPEENYIICLVKVHSDRDFFWSR